MTMTIVDDMPRRLMNGLDTSSNHFRSSDLLSILFLYCFQQVSNPRACFIVGPWGLSPLLVAPWWQYIRHGAKEAGDQLLAGELQERKVVCKMLCDCSSEP